jgi:Flp pilus assembly pilin Flp
MFSLCARLVVLFRRLKRGQRGQTLAEYGLILVLVAVVVAAAVTALGGGLRVYYSSIVEQLRALWGS